MFIQLIRWAARIIGGLHVAMFVWFFVAHALEAEGMPSLTPLEGTLMACMVTSLAGMVLLWFREGLGGLITVIGIGAFFAVDAAATGSLPRGWVLPLYFAPGVLSLLARALSRPKRDEGLPATGLREPGHA